MFTHSAKVYGPCQGSCGPLQDLRARRHPATCRAVQNRKRVAPGRYRTMLCEQRWIWFAMAQAKILTGRDPAYAWGFYSARQPCWLVEWVIQGSFIFKWLFAKAMIFFLLE